MPGFWSSNRVVVTGGRGFLGSYVVDKLHDRGVQEVHGIGRHDYDLRSVDAINRMYRELRPTVVIHAAAVVGGIGANSERPAEFFYENLVMGVHLMEAARLNGVRKFVSIGTVCAYPKMTPIPFKEADLWNGYPEETNAPYGLAKKMLLVQGQAYRQQYGMNCIFLLPVNLYGPKDHFDPSVSHVIPALIKKCVDAREAGAREITVWGDGSPTREFLFVEDAAEGITLATEHYDKPDPVNLGSAFEISIRDLVRLIAEATGFTGKIIFDPTKPNGQPRRKLDTSRAEREFGFRSRVQFPEGLSRTVEWYLTQRPASQFPQSARP